MDEAASLAPLDWVDAEVTVFPKGHTAMATSWSMPTSECALDACFSYESHASASSSDGQCRGPVRYQLDLDETHSQTELRRINPWTDNFWNSGAISC